MEESKRLINFRPLCVAAAFFAVGIACAYFAEYDLLKLAVCAFLLAALAVVCVIFSENRKSAVIALAVFALLFCIGYGYSFLKIQNAKNAAVPKNGGRVEIFATVERKTVTSGGEYRLVLRDVGGADFNFSFDGKAVCYVSAQKDYFEGDRVRLSCKAENRYMRGDDSAEVFCGVHYYLSSIKDLTVVGNDSNVFEKVSAAVRKIVKSGANEKGYGVALALVLGDTSLVGEEINAYRVSGIAHAFAVSGLHVGLFVAVFEFIAKRLKLKGVKKLAFILLPTAFYCFVCGFRPSSVRALVMAFTLIVADETGLKRDRMSAIAVALIAVLCVQPFYLFDVGARLSFLAVTGIAALAPVFKRGATPLKTLADPFCTTLGASLATLPVLVDMSGYMSLISLFANVIFVPLLSLAYQFTVICSALGAVEYLIFGSSTVCMFLPSALLTFIDGAVTFFDFGALTLNVSFGFSAFFYYFGLAFITDYFNLSAKSKAIVSLTAFLITAFFMVIPLF